MGRNRAPALPALFLVAACGGSIAEPPAPAAVTVQAQQEFELKMAQTARIDGTEVRLTLRAIPEDSRCPIDVVCVWQGNARAVLEVRQGEADPALSVSLNTGVPPMEAEALGMGIRLVGVLPAAESTVRIAQRDYSVLLVVTP